MLFIIFQFFCVFIVFCRVQFHFLMGVHFDAFKDKKRGSETPGKEPQRRTSLDPDTAARTARKEWVMFAKHLRSEIAEEFEVPDNVSARDATRLKSVLLTTLKIGMRCIDHSKNRHAFY